MNKSIYINSLNLEKTGDWDASHRLIQQYFTSEACWIHAYLHRVEGDLGNAAYWYSRAGKTMPVISLENEWEYLMEYMKAL
ncbi:MAG: hypothetical protein KDC09_01650 [Bacteroidales bacterium]|nr:hypothetical protein [Bacteroidales bacterium]